MKRVLVTGSEGFIGSHFVKHFRSTGWQVSQIDIHSPYPCDARSYFRGSDLQFDLVIHCAAVVGGRAFIEGSPLQLAAEDLTIDGEMWRWALRTKPRKIVYFSSSAAYPIELQRSTIFNRRLKESDINLDAIENPDTSYGWVKLTGEMMAESARAQGLDVYVFRPFSGYGTTQDLTYPFPAIMQRVRNLESPLQIWSNTVRDFVHVDDVVGCVLARLETENGAPVNICTGIPTAFKELAEIAMTWMNWSAPIQILQGKPAGVSYRVGDPTEMLKFYTPKIHLSEGVRKAIQNV